MTTRPNKITGANAGGPRQSAMRTRWARVAQFALRCVDHMGAKFRVKAVFSIEGRGTVLQGTIVNGEVGAGMHVIAFGMDRQRRIVAVEGIHGRQIAPGSVGLVLDDGGPSDVDDLRALLEGTVLDIT